MANGLALIALLLTAVVALAIYLLARGWSQRHALIDRTTGLANRKALKLSADDATLIVVARLERFSAIAASMGEQLGTILFVKVAERLAIANEATCVYQIDDVSLAWIEQAADAAGLQDRLEAIDRIMRSPIDCGRLIDISLNFGIAAIDSGQVDQAVTNASLAAIYAARKALRWHRFSGADEQETDWHLSLLSELDAAMTSGQLWNAYQPKLDLKSGKIVGAEALVRWLHPVRGPIPPASFIPLLEKHGRARDVTLHVLARAIEDTAQWESEGAAIGVSVNVPPALLPDSGFAEQVGKMLQSSAMMPERITIELAGIMPRRETDVVALERWREMGLGISIVDADTSLSSLEQLRKLPVTELKIEQSMIRELTSDETTAIIIRSTIDVAHEFGLRVIAEGIEDATSVKLLAEMGCDAGQGFHLGRPMSAANFRVFLGGGAVRAA